jgi:hypothetical protein
MFATNPLHFFNMRLQHKDGITRFLLWCRDFKEFLPPLRKIAIFVNYLAMGSFTIIYIVTYRNVARQHNNARKYELRFLCGLRTQQ